MASPPIAGDDAKQGANGANTRAGLRTFREGLISETFPRTAAANNSTATAGTVFYGIIPVFKGDLIKSGVAWVASAGTTLTLVKHALFTRDGATQLAVTASDHATYNGGSGTFVTDFTTPYLVTADDVLLFAHVEVGTTGASLLRGASANLATVGSGIRPYGTAGTGQADIPVAPLTLVAGSPAFWFGVV